MEVVVSFIENSVAIQVAAELWEIIRSSINKKIISEQLIVIEEYYPNGKIMRRTKIQSGEWKA